MGDKCPSALKCSMWEPKGLDPKIVPWKSAQHFQVGNWILNQKRQVVIQDYEDGRQVQETIPVPVRGKTLLEPRTKITSFSPKIRTCSWRILILQQPHLNHPLGRYTPTQPPPPPDSRQVLLPSPHLTHQLGRYTPTQPHLTHPLGRYTPTQPHLTHPLGRYTPTQPHLPSQSVGTPTQPPPPPATWQVLHAYSYPATLQVLPAYSYSATRQVLPACAYPDLAYPPVAFWLSSFNCNMLEWDIIPLHMVYFMSSTLSPRVTAETHSYLGPIN